MSRVFVAAAVIASLLAFARSEHVLDRTGLFGSCSALAAPAPNGGQWLACSAGEMTGYPDLSRDSCQKAGMRDAIRYWICPTALVAGRSSDETPTR